ncbi:MULTISPECIES: polysaccharide pyruvyl transferase family protein [unclassified Arthrobacter]|uniref:polysaccharide pyruvyl transferase family protein n=1 Tax=unclassified Arthrobacter TaxID=235627 RepID=UPI00149125B9|nr:MULTISPECIES: polysaccharide pyruvyl transferase family protein [unclassified Arthrobacter]MBE0008213.1 polysaccharide pyruvyl transferase family protein [Arthrobacter sp. AET 35A]NOJ61952.1 polysaccharide pyruvyl transferase family protein [Arthrobacter sp. 147(2020)]
MRVAILGDIGQHVYHVGDDAMTHAAVDELAARGVNDVVLLSRNVEDTTARFGTDAAPTIEFPWPYADYQRYLADIRSFLAGEAHGLAPDDQVHPLIETLRGCDAVLIAGGGNMNSVYGWLLYERAAVVEIAHHLGKTVLIAGQTIGPLLYGADRDVAARMLSRAALVGAREDSSLTLGRTLAGPAVVPCLDDASFLASTSLDTTADAAPAPGTSAPATADSVPAAGSYLVGTFSGSTGACPRDQFVAAAAKTLDDAAELSGLPVLLLPHMAVEGEGGVDETLHAEIAAAMTARVESRHIASARDTAAMTARAALVITSRYHPVVFALDGGVPTVALSLDEYSDVRLRGAMANWGLGDFTLPLPSLLAGSLGAAIREVWERRDETATHVHSLRPRKVADSAAWWDLVVRALQGTPVEAPTPAPAPRLLADGSWAADADAARVVFLPMSAELGELRKATEDLEGQASAARAELQGWFNSSSFALVRKLASLRTRLRPRRNP